jgi:hypothetical protein
MDIQRKARKMGSMWDMFISITEVVAPSDYLRFVVTSSLRLFEDEVKYDSFLSRNVLDKFI